MISKKLMSGFLCFVFLLPLTLILLGAEDNIYATSQKKKKEKKDWIEGPAGYIITKDEKKQYKKLKTEEEKEKFIQWFWARRDPNPETFRNEFQGEFNRRVNYANNNFKERRLDGWETARGRILIAFGPPSREWQEIISMGNKPAIFWMYDNPPSRYMRVMEPLVFVELYRDGRYFLLRPMPMDRFEYYFQRARPRSYFELVADEYFRAFEEVNKNSIQKPDLKIDDVEDKGIIDKIDTSEEIPFQWKIDFVPSSDDKIKLDVIISLQYKDISYNQEESKYIADFDISMRLLQGEESLIAELQDEINVALTEEELMAKATENLEYKGTLLATPGEYTIEITLKDKRTHIGKTVTEKITAESKSE